MSSSLEKHLWVLLLVALVSLGCTSASQTKKGPVYRQEQGPVKSQGHGPPPHAPAHGYRAKTQRGVELSYRSDLGVYVVIGASGFYFHDGAFFHRSDSGWMVGGRLEGPWQPVDDSDLPPGLQGKKKAKGKANGKNKGN